MITGMGGRDKFQRTGPDEQIENVREIMNRYTTDTWEALSTATSIISFVNPSAPK